MNPGGVGILSVSFAIGRTGGPLELLGVKFGVGLVGEGGKLFVLLLGDTSRLGGLSGSSLLSSLSGYSSVSSLSFEFGVRFGYP